jgi:hypothetical protein
LLLEPPIGSPTHARRFRRKVFAVEGTPATTHTLAKAIGLVDGALVWRFTCGGVHEPVALPASEIASPEFPAAAAPTLQAHEPLPAAAEHRRRVGERHELVDADAPRCFQAVAEGARLDRGHNIRIDIRYSDGNPERTRIAAAELLALTPDVLLAYANPAVSALQPLTRTIPIVFTQVSAPVESGFVSSASRG